MILFDPTESRELLRGWQLHTTRRRAIHEQAARGAQRASYWLGAAATVFAAVAGSSAFVATKDETPSTALGLVALALGLTAAIVSPLQATLDLGGRAERHRQAAVDYKRLLRTFERIPPDIGTIPKPDRDGALSKMLRNLEARLADADAAAPVVPARLARRVESSPIAVVPDAASLAPGQSEVPAAAPQAGTSETPTTTFGRNER